MTWVCMYVGELITSMICSLLHVFKVQILAILAR